MASVAETQKKQGILNLFDKGEPPTVEQIIWLLTNGDVKSLTSPLHRIGTSESDAAAGNHTHNGRNSALLFNGTTINGDLSTNAGQQQALHTICQLLASLGATNATTN